MRLRPLDPDPLPLSSVVAFEAAERGELGGCGVREGRNRRCRTCRLVDGEHQDWDGLYGPTDGEFAEFHRPLSDELLNETNKIITVDELALSFDGYAALGDELYSVMRRRPNGSNAPVPCRPTLSGCGAALFFEQRCAHHRGDGMDRPYIHALVGHYVPWLHRKAQLKEGRRCAGPIADVEDNADHSLASALSPESGAMSGTVRFMTSKNAGRSHGAS